MGNPSQNMEDLAELCRKAKWRVHEGTRAYIVTNHADKTMQFSRLAARKDSYDSARKRLRLHGLDRDLAKVETEENTARLARLAADQEANSRRLEGAAKKSNKKTPAAADVPATPATTAAVSVRDRNPFIGVAGLLSLGDDFDLSQVVVDPEDRPKPGSMQVTVYELVTPERVEELKQRDVGILDDGTVLEQRNLSPADVNRYVGILQRDLLQQIEKGAGRPYHPEWVVAEPAMLAPEEPVNTGGVIDGQHRFEAIVKSGIPAIMRINYNTPPKVFLALNQGRKRTDGDVLRMRGFKQTSHLASAGKLLWCWWQWRKDLTGPYANWRNWPRLRATTIQLEAFMATPWPDGLMDPETGESLLVPQVAPGSSLMTGIGGVPAAGITFRVLVLDAWRAVNRDQGEARLEEFCAMLRRGAGPGYDTGHPVHTLREWITHGTGSRNRNYKREFQLNGMLRAWDYFANSQKLGRILVNEEGLMPLAWAPGLRTLTDYNTTRFSQR